MNFTIENLEFILLVLVRISSFIMSAPFFGYSSIPMRVKLMISVVLGIIVIQMIPPVSLDYTGVIGYTSLLVKEACIGVALGFMPNICLYILNFTGQLMDMELGLSMASMFDPLTRVQGTISGTLYTYVVMLIMMVSNLHYFLILAIVDSFEYFNIGKAVFSQKITDVIVDFFPNFFIIGFRILLPIFGCMLLVNVVLGVLARATPQMNMFVVGMQLKVIIGILVLFLVVETIPGVANFIFEEMKTVTNQLMDAFTPK